MKLPFIAPEVLQTSSMDCGPAALKCVLDGFGRPTSYAELRALAHTSADGTSIDDLEDVAIERGLRAHQEIVPLWAARDVLAQVAPCVVAVRGPGGGPHFVVLWRRLGDWFQIMDPAVGRRWVRRRHFLDELHVHVQSFERADFAAWAPTSRWWMHLAGRARRWLSGAPPLAADDPSWVGAVDDTVQLFERWGRRLGASRGAATVVARNFRAGAPRPFRCAVETSEDRVSLSGAVVLVLRGHPSASSTEPSSAPTARSSRTDLRSLLSHPRAALGLVAAAALLATVETLFVRASFQAAQWLGLPRQSFAFTALLFVVFALGLLVDSSSRSMAMHMGAALDVRVRARLLDKLPRLPDAYFRTRPFADVVQRANGLLVLRSIPEGLMVAIRAGVDVVVTLAALLWIFPAGWAIVLALALTTWIGPMIAHRLRFAAERRAQTHEASLAIVQLDALLGLTALQSHGGERAMRANQDAAMSEWAMQARASSALRRGVDAVQAGGALVGAAALLAQVIRTEHAASSLLLVAFWALRLPYQGMAFGDALERLPTWKSAFDRLTDPLDAPTSPDPLPATEDTIVMNRRAGLHLVLHDVSVRLSGQAVLERVSFSVAAGEHVAVVGSSGGGKSSLVAAILGLLERERGAVMVDGVPVERYDLQRLRRECVWVDPSVQLWNRSLEANLQFGNPREARNELDEALDASGLDTVLDRLGDGLRTRLGEAGSRVSGGEGQRVRIGRALLRRGARLLLLDEAFRGLERGERLRLSRAIRERHRGVSVVEVTHDVAATEDFDRVLVVEGGRVVEHGRPRDLLQRDDSRYRHLFDADRRALERVWADRRWRRATVANRTILPSEAST